MAGAGGPIIIFCGSSPDAMDIEAEIALEHSIRSRTKADVEIHWMRLSRDPSSPWYSHPSTGKGWDTREWTTPFSRFRWAIPRVCNFSGRAIYLDVDMLCLADIEELWSAPMHGHIMAKSPKRFCAMLMDCAKFKPGVQVDATRLDVDPFPAGQNWNCLDGERLRLDDPSLKILHLTSINSQPHLPLSRARLAKIGLKHWFTGPIEPHWRPEITALWHHEFEAALHAMRSTSALPQPGPEFGAFPMRSHENFRGVRPRGVL